MYRFVYIQIRRQHRLVGWKSLYIFLYWIKQIVNISLWNFSGPAQLYRYSAGKHYFPPYHSDSVLASKVTTIQVVFNCWKYFGNILIDEARSHRDKLNILIKTLKINNTIWLGIYKINTIVKLRSDLQTFMSNIRRPNMSELKWIDTPLDADQNISQYIIQLNILHVQ